MLRREKFAFDQDLTDPLLAFLETEGELVASAPLGLALPDPADAMFLEVAAAGGADFLVTGNLRHFPTGMRSGLVVLSPREFLDAAVSG